jgi:hypothetical protein
MKTSIIIVADIGTLKAFHVKERSLTHRKKADLIKKIFYTTAHTKLRDQLTDAGGRFRGSGDIHSGAVATSEAHNLKSDLHKKAHRAIAHDIEGVVRHISADDYYLALPKPISAAVTDELKKDVRSKLTKLITADLTKDTLDDIRTRFKV